MSIFKRASVSGINYELIRQGKVAYPSKQAADAVSDMVADALPEGEAQTPIGPVPGITPEAGPGPDEVAEIAAKLIEVANELKALSAQGVVGDKQASEDNYKVACENLHKAASELDRDTYVELASKIAVELMDKAAGSLVEGGDKGNSLADAAKTTEMGALEQKQRPEGAYTGPRGSTQLNTLKGLIGKLEEHEKKPHNSPAGSNSLTADVKSAALAKLAGSLVMKGQTPGNTLTDAAKETEIGKLELANRPEGYAVVGKGNANFSLEQGARIGLEKKPDVVPSNSPAGTNSVIEASKAASDEAFTILFKKTASEVISLIPNALSNEQKVAAVRHMIGMDGEERKEYAKNLHEKEETSKEEKKEDKKEKEEEKKKEASFLNILSEIARK